MKKYNFLSFLSSSSRSFSVWNVVLFAFLFGFFTTPSLGFSKEPVSGIWQNKEITAYPNKDGTLAPLPQVNIMLWKASLDVMKKLPILQADPFSGLIFSDWFTLPKAPDDRFKAQIHISTKQLDVDGLSVNILHQKKKKGTWQEAQDSDALSKKIKKEILYRSKRLLAQRNEN